VAQVQSGTPAEQAGLRAGDQIEAVDGHAFHSTNTLLAYMQWGQGKPMTLTLLRNGATVQITATPAKTDTRFMLGFAPQPVLMRNQPLSFIAAWEKSGAFFKNNSLIVAEVLNRLFTHRLSISQLMGTGGHCPGRGRSRPDQRLDVEVRTGQHDQPAAGYPESDALPDSRRRHDSAADD
jgi:regulator of sigma E protease